MKWLQNSVTIVLLLAFSHCSCLVASAEEWDWANAGPAYDRFELTLAEGERTEAVGPFYYRERQGTRTIWAIPPVLSYSYDPDIQKTEFDLAFPLLSYIRSGDQYRLQVMQLLSFAGGPTQSEATRDRITLFPLFFWQGSSDTNKSYAAYGPFYGHLQNRLFRDEIDYVMFPAYSRTRKRDVVTWNYLFPIFHVREGNELRGWQAWPLYGREVKGISSSTNLFGDVEPVPGHERTFVLWPFFHDQTTDIGGTNQTWQQAFLPLYFLTRSPARDQTTVVWPFFSKITERSKKYVEWHAPWPFVGFASGPGKSMTRILPLYSHAQTTNQESTVYLWPLYRKTRLRSEPLDRQRTRILFFLYGDTEDRNTETGKAKRRRDLWPLFTHRKELDGNERLQIFAPLEPLLPGNENIELEYSPIWSVWRSESNAKTGARSQSLLWNLYRRSKTKTASEWSALFGLVQHRRDENGGRLRLFYFPLSDGSKDKAN